MTPDDVADRLEMSNLDVAGALDELSDLLEAQGANPFRVRAYRRAAATVRGLSQPVREILDQQGIGGLLQIPGIGKSLAHSIDDLVHLGSLPMLERLRGQHQPERMFATVAEIGPVLAERIHRTLGIESLGELAAAACDGRLNQVEGMGSKRVQAVREALAGRFGRSIQPSRSPPPSQTDEPSVEELLSVDREYRRLARRGQLPKVAPKHFNPTGQAWLPILHTARGDRHYTAMFSNTRHAHEVGAVRDWVVIYRDDESDGGCWTVITSAYGQLRGHRIVRGRERECEQYYGEHARTQLPLDFRDD